MLPKQGICPLQRPRSASRTACPPASALHATACVPLAVVSLSLSFARSLSLSLSVSPSLPPSVPPSLSHLPRLHSWGKMADACAICAVVAVLLPACAPYAVTSVRGGDPPATDCYKDPNVVVVALSDVDINAIKKKFGLGTRVDNTYLALQAGTIRDMTALDLAAINSTKPMKASDVKKDITGPQLKEYTLNMDTLVLALTFSETVDTSTFNETTLTLVATASGTSGVKLTGSKRLSTNDSTVVTVWLSPTDANAVKQDPALCTKDTSTFLIVDKTTIKDMAANELVPAGTLQTKVFSEDKTAPKVTSSVLNMNEGTLKLTFDETVDRSSVQPQDISVQDKLATATVPLKNSLVAVGKDETSVTVNIGATDLNLIKFYHLVATSKTNTYVVVGDKGVQDMNQVGIAKATFQAEHVPDTTKPTVKCFSLDMTKGELSLDFDEVINVNSLVFKGVVLQNNALSPNSTRLSGGNLTSKQNGLSVTVELTPKDLNLIKVQESVATDKTDTFLSLDADSIKDMNGQGVVAIAKAKPLPVCHFVDDLKAGEITSYQLDMDDGLLTVFFSETMDAASVAAAEVTLQSGSDATAVGAASHKLGGEVVNSRPDLNEISIFLTFDDMEKIKLEDKIATAKTNTYLSASLKFIKDQAGVAVKSIAASSAMQADAFDKDTTKPKITTALEFDLGPGELTAKFSESIRMSSVKTGDLLLENENGGGTIGLGGAAVKSSNGRDLVLVLTPGQKNAVKGETSLCISAATCVFVIATGALLDMAGNEIAGAKQVTTKWSNDVVSPKLAKFSYAQDSNLATVTLTFDETVRRSDLNLEGITLQNKQSATAERTIAKATTKSVDGLEVVLSLSKADVDEIKRLNFCISDKDCYVRIAPKLIKDMSGNAVAEVTDAGARKVDVFAGDSVRPTLTSFANFDFNTGELTLKFDEPVDPSTILAKEVSLQDTGFDGSINEQLVFTNGTTASKVGPEIVLKMSTFDLNKLKLKTNLCKFKTSCVLRLTNAFVKDMRSNLLDDFSPAFKFLAIPDKVVLDATSPKITGATFNENTGTLVLTFDEPVASQGLAPTAIVLQNSKENANVTAFVQMTSSDTISHADSTVSTVTMVASDLAQIKADQALCTKVKNCFLSVSNKLVQDVGNPANFNDATSATNALQVGSFTADKVEPKFVTFVKANPNLGTFTLEFSEPVNTATLVFGAITVQSSATSPAASYTLKKALAKIEYVVKTQKTQITVTLHADDLHQIQLKTTSLFSNRANTYVSIAANGIKDMTKLDLQSNVAALQTATFQEREVVNLNSFDLNMATAELVLHFDGTVDTATFEPTEIILRSSSSVSVDTQVVTLSKFSTTSSANGFLVIIKIGNSDMNSIKAQRALATSKDTTIIEMTAKAFIDVFNQRISSLVPLDNFKVDKFVTDSVKPSLQSFQVAIDAGTVSLQFSEEIDLKIFSATGLTFTDEKSTTTLKLEKSNIVSTTSNDATDSADAFTIQFTGDDLNRMKFDLAIGTSTSNTYIVVDPTAAKDMTGNAVSAATVQASKVTVDDTKPVFKSFVIDLSLGTLTMTFSEAVTASSIVPAKLVVKEFTNTHLKKLTGGTPKQVSETVVELTFAPGDLNYIKATRGLAVSKATTFLQMAAGAILDTYNNEVIKTEDGNPKQASAFQEDIVSPVLDQFDMDLTKNQIELRFSETVDGKSYSAAAVTLQSKSAAGNDVAPLTLSSLSTLVQAIDSPTLTIDLSKGDIDTIKNTVGFCDSKTDVFVSITDLAFADTNKRKIVAIPTTKALDATKYTKDGTPPKLTAFSFNLHTHVLTLNFDEPVDTKDVNVTSLVFQSVKDNTNTGTNFRLKGAKKVQRTSDGLKVEVTLTESDANAIKADDVLCTQPSATYLRHGDNFIVDMAGNKISPIAASSATLAQQFIDDSVRPSITKFALDMNAEQLTLYFSETMDEATLGVGAITLSTARGGSVTHTLTKTVSTVVTTQPGLVAVVAIGLADMHILKQKEIGSSQAASVLSFADGGILDMNTNKVTALMSGVSDIVATGWVKDITFPVLNSYEISLQAETLSMHFSEVVKAQLFKGAELTLQNTNNLKKTCPCSACLNSEWMVKTCSAVVDTQCQACELCLVGTYETAACTKSSDSNCRTCETCPVGQYMDTWCYGTTPTLCKTCGANCAECTGPGTCNKCAPGTVLIKTQDYLLTVDTCAATCPPGMYEEDGVCANCHPTCKTCTGAGATNCDSCPDRFQIDPVTKSKCVQACYDSGTGKFEAGSQNCADCSDECKECFGAKATECLACKATQPFMLGRFTCKGACPEAFFATTDGTGDKVCAACIPRCSICSNAKTCLKCETGWELDTSNNKCFYATTASEQAGFAADGKKQIAYPVGGSTRGDTTCSITSVTAHKFILNSASTKSDNGPDITVDIGDTNLNKLKSILDLAVSKETSFLAMTVNGITDMRGNKVVAISDQHNCPDPCFGVCDCPIKNLNANKFVNDATKPKLVSFTTNLNGKGLFTLVFSETINKGSVNLAEMSLQVTKTKSTATESVNFLNGGQFTMIGLKSLSVVPTVKKFNEIKALRKLAIDEASTHITLTENFLTDNTFANKLDAVTPLSAQKTDKFDEDKTNPTLVRWEMNMDTAVMTLTFDETMDAATMNPAKITLINSITTLTLDSTLKGRDVSKKDSTIIAITVTLDDLNAIKKNTGLCVSQVSCFLALTDASAQDANKNPVVAITNDKAVRAGKFIHDTTDPVLNSFDLDLDKGLLHMRFSETIRVGSLVSKAFTLQSASDSTGKTGVALELKIKPTVDSEQVTLTLSTTTLNAIKMDTALALNEGTTFLAVTIAGLQDMDQQNDNRITAIPLGKCLKVAKYTGDTSFPELDSFELDMGALKLTLSFTETVKASTLDVETIVLQNNKLNAIVGQHVRLSDKSKTASKDGPVIVIDIAEADANDIKTADQLATTSIKDTYMVVTTGTVRDMDDNKLVAVATQAKAFKADNVSPTLQSFDVDMDKLTVKLTFSETIKSESLKLERITFQSKKTGGTTHVLSDGKRSVANKNMVTITILKLNADQIKAKTDLMSKKEDTFISLATGAITDMRGNDADEIKATSAQQSNAYANDVTAPYLVSFTALMPLQKPPVKLELEFSESVALVGTNIGNIIFYESTDLTGKSYRLTQGTASRHPDSSTKLDVTLSPKDLKGIIALTGVVRTTGQTNIRLDATAIKDEAGNANTKSTKSIQPTTHTVDITPPQLSTFDVDLSKDQIILHFSEAVTASTFEQAKVTVQATETLGASSHELKGNTFESGTKHGLADSDVVISLTQGQADLIKADRALAADKASTFIAIIKDIVQDPAQNLALGVSSTKAMQVDKYTADTVPPTIVSYDLDMTLGKLTMVFNEVVAVSSINLTAAKFRDTASDIAGTITSPSLSGTAAGADSTKIVAMLDLKSANNLRGIKGVAVSQTTTQLTFTSNFAKDVDDNAIVDTVLKGVLVTKFTEDLKPPTPSGFSIDLEGGSMTLTFVEPVDASTVDVKKRLLTLQNTKTSATSSYTLTDGVVTGGLSTEVSIAFTTTDLNQIKRKPLCTKKGGKTSCFVAFGGEFIKDTTGLKVAAVGDLSCVSYTPDATPPALIKKIGFNEFNLNLGQMTLSFSEVIDRTSIDVSKIVVKNDDSKTAATASFTLSEDTTGGKAIENDDRTIHVIQLTDNDRNAIKANHDLCTKRSDCYLEMRQGGFIDFADNQITATDTTEYLKVVSFSDDTTDPNLVSFDLNMNKPSITMTFDETVDISSLKRSGITLLDSASASTKNAVNLESCGDGSVCTISTDGTVVKIDITDDDTNRIKLLQYASGFSDSFVAITTATITDTQRVTPNKVTAIAADKAMQVKQSVGSYTKDATVPKFTAFTFDLEKSIATLTFSEPIKPGVVDFSSIVLQGSATSRQESVRLNKGTIQETSSASMTITIQLSAGDTVAVKSNKNMFTTQDDSFISLDQGAVVDLADLPVKAVAADKAIKAGAPYGGDNIRGKLQKYTLDLAQRLLILSFDEVIDISSFSAGAIRLQVSGNKDTGTHLSDSTIQGANDTATVVVALSRADYVTLGEDPTIATSTTNTYLSMLASAFDDYNGRNILAIVHAKGQKVGNVVPDVTAPTVTASQLDLTKGEFALTFSEPINKKVFKIGAITVQSHTDGTTAGLETRKLASTLYAVNKARDVVTITLNDDDLNYVKLADKIAVSTTSTFINYGRDLVVDLANNGVVAVVSGKAAAVTKVIADTKAPTLVSFGINMDDGILEMTFSEAVRADTIAPKQLMLQDAGPSSATHRLRGGTPSQTNGLSMNITLTVGDLNAIKGKAMTSQKTDTYLRVLTAAVKETAAVKDMNKNDITALSDAGAMLASSFKDDLTPPKLVSFDLDMTTEMLSFVFSETVTAKSITPAEFTLQSEAASNAVNYTLKFGTPSTTDSTKVTIKMDKKDVDAIKAMPKLAFQKTATFLTITPKSVTDVSGNAVVAVTADKALPVGDFKQDATVPTIVDFTLSITTGQVRMSFSETIDPAKFNATKVTFQSEKIANLGTSKVTLSDAEKVSTTPDTELTFSLIKADLDTIKQDTTLAVSAATTFVSFPKEMIQDTAANPIEPVAVLSGLAVKTGGFEKDTVRPVVNSFDLDLDQMVLLISMSEPIKATVDTTAISLQNADASESYTLTAWDTATLGPQITQSSGEKVLSVKMSQTDVDQLKIRRKLATSKTDTLLLVTKDLAVDKSDNSVVALTAADKMAPNAYQTDKTPPTIVSVYYSVSDGVLVIVWSEAIDVTKWDPTGVLFSATAGRRARRADAGSLRLDDKGVVTYSNKIPNTLSYKLSKANREAIKADVTLCNSPTTCYVLFASKAMQDLFGSLMVAYDKPVQNLVKDTSAPELESFELSMNSLVLSLTFTETVDVSELNVQQLALVKSTAIVTGKVDGVRLTAGTISQTDSTIVTIVLAAADANAIKADTALCATEANTFLQIMDDFVWDMAKVKLVTPPAAKKAAKTVPDTTDPTMTAAHLDLNQGTLTLDFDETVNAAKLTLPSIRLQEAATSTANYLTLTDGSGAGAAEVEVVPLVIPFVSGTAIQTSIKITLAKADLDNIKKMTALAISKISSHIVMAQGAVLDMATNKLVAITKDQAQKCSSYTPDTTKPTLDGFEIDMTKGTLRLKFSETVNALSLKADKITLHDCKP